MWCRGIRDQKKGLPGLAERERDGGRDGQTDRQTDLEGQQGEEERDQGQKAGREEEMEWG